MLNMEAKEYIEGIIYRHLNNEASEKEEAELAAWLRESADNKNEFDSMLQVWNESSGLAHEQHFDEASAWQSLENKINSFHAAAATLTIRPFFRRPLAAAATVIVIALIAGTIYYFTTPIEPVQITVSAIENNQRLQLPDGSSITLRKGSTLKYDRSFGLTARNVQLTGEAYFDVAHNENMKFRVKANHSIIEEMGTAFLIRSSGDSDQVFVDRGSVKFADVKDEERMVILSAGQKASLVGKVFDKDSIRDSNYLSWQSGVLKFEHSSLRSMVEDINHHYHANIRMSDSLAAKSDTIKVNFRFEKNNLEEVLEEIQVATGLKAEKKNDIILLH